MSSDTESNPGNVDLTDLRIEEAPIPRRPLGPRIFALIVLALVIVIGATFAWPLLRPARPVQTAPVRVAVGGPTQTTSAATTEAVGWVEADPYPIIVRPLVSGHVETLNVLEGAIVKRDETVIGTMVSAELQASHERAEATLKERAANLEKAEADHTLAKERMRQNATTRLQLLEANAKLVALQTKHATAQESLGRAKATARDATATLAAQELLAKAGSSYPVALERARAAAATAKAEIGHEEQLITGLAAEIVAQQKLVALCEELAKNPVDLRGAIAIRAAAVRAAAAALGSARTDVAIAKRELQWATVTSPVDGVVLRLEAEPGDMVGHGAQGMVALYDPTKLRARIDVPIDSLAGIHEGQKVEIRSEAIGEHVVHGVVQRLQHETDLLKNTLQVKIGLVDPPPLLRPETLCRARFLATNEGKDASQRVDQSFRVPQAAVQDGRVFVLDPVARTARAIPVEVIGEAGADRIVRGTLSPTQRVVVEPVEAGESIRERQP